MKRSEYCKENKDPY